MSLLPLARLSRLEAATTELEPPFAVVDLDAFWRNAADMERRAGGKPIYAGDRPSGAGDKSSGDGNKSSGDGDTPIWAGGKPIRLASKSVRCRALQERVLARPGFQGTLAFTLPEALWLADCDFKDVLVAYPTADRESLRKLGRRCDRPGRSGQTGAQVVVMVDSVAQLELIEPGAEIDVCMDLDAGLWMLDGRVRIGAKRSPIHTPEQAAALAQAILAHKGARLVGIMAYESQIAGLGDSPPGRRLRGATIRVLRRRSARELALRRAAAVAAVQEVLRVAGAEPLRFVNGGGTGSLELTGAEQAVTEIAAGSGLYGPTLFDAYRAFQPEAAALFALPVVRKPSHGVATVLGGGYLASGPADAARLPTPFWPTGLTLDKQEGAGEVQTPLIGEAARRLNVGDRVWFRHAKAGELCERFDRLHLVEGERIVEELPTYRGEGKCFL